MDALLDGLLDEALQPADAGGRLQPFEQPSEQPPPATKVPDKVRKFPQRGNKPCYSHDGMIDLIIQNPAIHQNALAAHFGYTASWVSQIISSDAFQARLAERKDELVDPTIRATVEQNFKALVTRSLDILMHKLNKHPDDIPDQLALRTMEIASRAAGYGVAADVKPPVAEMHLHLDSLGDRLTNLIQRRRAAVTMENENDPFKEIK